jgi:alpha-methylacyl-CoA racemase
LIGDYGGGGMLLAFGIACAVIEARDSGRGQVVDAAMVDGSALLTTAVYGDFKAGTWQPERGTNLLDSGAPFYDVYETADNQFISVGALESGFYDSLVEKLGLDPSVLPAQNDRAQWPATRKRFAAVFKTRSRVEWCDLLEGTDACLAPVLSLAEAPLHPHNRARRTFVEVGGVTQPAPAPRFSRTPGAIAGAPAVPGSDTAEILSELGFAEEEVKQLI